GDSTLSAVVQSIIASEVGYHELALRYFTMALFVDLIDVHGNTSDGVHVASTGGVWSALAFGFGGLRDHGGDMTMDPRPPELRAALTYRITLQGTRVRVDLRQNELELSVEEGASASLSVRGKAVTVTADEPVLVPLANQGPRLDGGPGASPQVGVRR